MDILNNIGISFSDNYLLQGNLDDKLKIVKKNKIKNVCFKLNDKDYNLDIKKIDCNAIIHLPTINNNLSNLKKVDAFVKELSLNDKYMVSINTSNLTHEEFEFSSPEERKLYFKNIVTAISKLASNRVVVAVENPLFKGDETGMFGEDITAITDIIVYSRKMLILEHNFTENEANKYIGLSFNIDNLYKNTNKEEIEKWFSVFYNDIKCIKINNMNMTELFDITMENITKYNMDSKLVLEEEKELEVISDDYKKFHDTVINKLKEKNITIDEKSEEKGYADIICISMIVLTVLIAILMIYVKFKA